MARQEINLGSAPTGVGGDTTRSTGVKINAMTQELYARNAQLGSASNANIGTSPGNVMAVGSYGLGPRVASEARIYDSMNVWETGFGVITETTQFKPSNFAYGTLLNIAFPGTGFLGTQLWMSTLGGGVIGFRSGDYSTGSFNTIYHTGNTTRAADGTLKAI